MAIQLSATKLTLLAIVIALLLISPALAGFSEQDLTMEGSYTFTGTFVDVSNNIINVVTVSDTTGYGTTTSTGIFSNTYPYGEVTFTFTSTQYVSKTVTYMMENDTITNITLTESTGGGSQTMYNTPHRVRFTCRDYRGDPVTDMSVTAIGVESTLGSVDWVLTLFGINLDSTPLIDTLMSGTTGTDGSVVFIMMETEKYRLNFSKPSQGIGEYRYYYPAQTEYNEIFWTEEPAQSSTIIDWVFYNYSVNDTYMKLGVEYTDTLMTTDNLTFRVQDNQSNTIYTQNRIGAYIINSSYDVPMYSGETYYWGFTANSTSYSKEFNVSHFITFSGNKWQIDPMGAGKLGADPILAATAAIVYNWAAVGLIMIFGLIFGRFSMKIGIVVVPLMGALFKYIGWLDITWLLVSVALGLGIMMSFRFAEEEASV